MSASHSTRDALLTRAMGASFALGASCFLVGPLPVYSGHVSTGTDNATFFVGSILFTLGGLFQSALAAPERNDRPTGLATWRTAWIQSIGTLLFNVMTVAAMAVASGSARYDYLVWSPNALGSVCFLVSGAIFYLSSPRRGLLPRRRHEGWWEPAINLLGCVLFGISAIGAYATGRANVPISAGVANWTTAGGAACFLACALMACGLGKTLKAPRMRRLRQLEHDLVEVFEYVSETVLRYERDAPWEDGTA